VDIKLMPEKYKKRTRVGSELKQSLFGFFHARTNLWLILSSGLLIIVVLICFGLWGYKISLNKDKEVLAKKFEELQSQRNLDLEARFISLKKGIENFKIIFQDRVHPLNLFRMLEELTLPQVQFTNFDVDFSQFRLGLETKTVNYNSLAKQMVIFEQDSRIQKVDLSRLSLDSTGGVSFHLDLKLDPAFLSSE
jgi:hypothetical protein